MKFSPSGPDIPAKLIDAAIHGEVVFLCGAGVSLPSGLPSFPQLTQNVFTRLGLAMDPAEQRSFESNRYEETLGSLNRRLADRRSLYEAVAKELDADKAANIDAHTTLLRLSRDFEGRPAIVTTNFDTLFERTLHELTSEPVGDKSFASAQVPAPAGPRFEGIIHLHGRLAEKRLDLDESDLVLTSADYGDAYLRSGWAARFLYDLARTRTIVLVGYSASDAPVRYILNILEADRERFPDLKTIYVLAQAKADDPNPSAEWDAIAVKAITFTIGFPEFWADMAAWADLVELPRKWRKTRLEELAPRRFADLSDWEREQARWILGHQDAIVVLSQLPFSPDWIAYAREQKLFAADSKSDWSLCTWAARHLDSADAFIETLKSLPTIGNRAVNIIDRALEAKDRKPIPVHLEKAWRLLSTAVRQPKTLDRWMHYAAFARIKAKSATGDDLREIVRIFTPQLSLRPASYAYPDEAETLSSLCRIEFETTNHPTFDEFLKELPSDSPDLTALLHLASGAMFDVLLLARDANVASTAYDLTIYDVPSIYDHVQNEHHSGFLPIVRLCAELWLRTLLAAPAAARAISDVWKHGGFGLTTRLWLFGLHNDHAVKDDQIVDALLGLPQANFWAHRKEVMELLRDRTRNASPKSLDRLVTRIAEGPAPTGDRDLDEQQAVKDAYCWVYLSALEFGVAALPAQARLLLDQINERKNWSARSLEESDYFWMWAHGVRNGPIGDPEPIAEAPTQRRIEVAFNLERTDHFNQMDAWSVYCRHDPEGALEASIAAANVVEHSERWRDVLWAISSVGDQKPEAKERGSTLCVKAITTLRPTPIDDLANLTHPLVELFEYSTRVEAPLPEDTWEWLWRCSVGHEREVRPFSQDKEAGYELISQAINSPSGKLARLVINRFGPDWKDQPEAERQLITQRFEQMLASASNAGTLSRAVIVEFINWLNITLPDLVDRHILPALNADTNEGFALRSVLVGLSRGHGATLRKKLATPTLRAIQEFRGKGPTAENTASRLLLLARDDLKSAAGVPVVLAPGEARSVLASATPEVRAAAAEVLADWIEDRNGPHPHEAWRDDLSKIFGSVWPADKKSLTTAASISLSKLALSAGEAFPEALDAILPYIKPIRDDWPSLYFAAREEAAPTIQRHPRQTLSLLWALLKPADYGQSNELTKVLDRIQAADASLERDRRFQLLEARAMRIE